MPYEEILYEVGDRIATISLNRPDKLNALTRTMEEEIHEAVWQADADPEVRVIILTGAGRGFCAGADMNDLNGLAGEDLSTVDAEDFKKRLVPPRPREGVRPDFQKTYSYFPAVQKPIIGAINGVAVGLGFILPLYCDIRICSDEARFGTAFSRRGIIAEHGVSWLLPRLVGIANALDLLYSARLIDAAEALRMGLVSQVVPADSLLEQVRAYAGELATKVSSRSLRVMKRQVYEALFQTLDEAIESANDEMLPAFRSEDFREGVAHYLERRPPKFPPPLSGDRAGEEPHRP